MYEQNTHEQLDDNVWMEVLNFLPKPTYLKKHPGLETTYPFPRTVKVDAGASIAIWSSGEVEHKPKEGQYVMKVEFKKFLGCF